MNPIDIRMAKPKPATRAEILEELARIAGRCNGLITKEAIAIWADDLADEHDFAVIDYRAAGRALPARIAEGGRGAASGRPQLTDIVDLAKAARAKRLEAAAQARGGLRLEARTERTPGEIAANKATASWVAARVFERKAPSEAETKAFYAARLAEEQKR